MSENPNQRIGIDIETTYSGKGAETAKRDLGSIGQELKKTEGQMRQMATASDLSEVSLFRQEGALGKLDQELERFLGVADKGYRAQRMLDQGNDLVFRSLKAGLITQEQHNAILGRLSEKYGSAAMGAKELANQTQLTARETGVLIRSLARGDIDQASQSTAQIASRMSLAGSAATRFAVGVTAGVAAVGLAVFANERWNRELNATNVLLLASGRSVELSRGHLAGLVTEMQRAANMNRSSAFAAVGALAQTPNLRGGMIGNLAGLTSDFATATGRSPADAARELGRAFADPVQGARNLSASLNILSADQLLLIERMTAQGRVLEAQQLLYGALKDRIQGLTTQGLTPLEAQTNRLSNAWNGMWERMYKSEAFERAAARVSRTAALLAWMLEPGGAGGDLDASGRPAKTGRKPAEVMGPPVPDLNDQVLRALQAGEQYDPKGARRRSLGDAATNIRAAMDRLEGAGQTGGESYSRLQAQLAGVNREAARRTPEENAAEQMDRVISKLKSEASRAADDLEESPEVKRYFEAIERITTGDLHERSLGQRQGYAAAATERLQAEQDARQRKELMATGYSGSPEFMKMNKEQQDFENWAGREQGQESEKVTRLREEMVHATQQSNARMIQDDSARAWTSFEEEKRVMRRKIDALKPYSEERKALEEDYATWTVARHAEITEQLKPQWQKMVETYSDTTRQMREATDRFVIGGLRAGENAFVEWARTGKLSAQDLFGTIRDEMVRTFYQQQLAGPIAGGLASIAKFIFGGGGGGGPAAAYDYSMDGADLSGAEVKHSGGIVGAGAYRRSVNPMVFAGAQRYHRGGLVPGEVPIIARRGEEVLTESDPRHRRNGGGNIKVEIINPPGQKNEVAEVQPRIDVDGMVVRVILRDQREGGPISRGFGNTFGLRRSAG